MCEARNRMLCTSTCFCCVKWGQCAVGLLFAFYVCLTSWELAPCRVYIACNMKRTIPLADPVDVISSDESSFSDADTKINDGIDGHHLPDDVTNPSKK